MQPIPDRGVVAAIRAVDRDLSVEWIDPPGRFAIFHALQLPGRPDEVADRTAAELQRTAALHGYLLDKSECAFAAGQALRDAKLVCYVTEDDGSFRPLDFRVVEKLQRMDFYRRNLGLKDWTALVRAKADAARERRERDGADLWETIRRDKVFARIASDILWGAPVTRSVHAKEVPRAASELRPEVDPGDGARAPTDDHRGEERDAVAPAVRDAGAAHPADAA